MREPVPDELSHLAAWHEDSLVLWRTTASLLGFKVWTRVTIAKEVTVHSWPSSELKPDRVLLRGEAGMTVQILFQGLRTIGVSYAQPRRGDLTVHGIRWLAVQAAQRLGVPLVDEVSDADWDRWFVDEPYRNDLRFERGARVNERRNRHLFDSIEPTDAHLRMQHDRVQYGKVSLRPPLLADGWYEILLDEVRSVYVEVRGNALALQVLSERGVAALGTCRYTEENFASYRWMAGRILEAAQQARDVDRGSVRDVPDALDVLRSPES